MLTSYYNELNKFYSLNPQKESTIEKKSNCVMFQGYIICNYKLTFINTWLFQITKKKISDEYDPINLSLETYNYKDWFKNEESAGTARKSDREGSIDLFDMPFLGDEDVKERKGLKILTPNTFLTRLPILLAQIKAENN